MGVALIVTRHSRVRHACFVKPQRVRRRARSRRSAALPRSGNVSLNALCNRGLAEADVTVCFDV